MNRSWMAGVTAAALLAAGCGGPQDRTTVGHWSIEVPMQWKASQPSDPAVWQKAWDVDGTHVEVNGQALDKASPSTAINMMGFAATTNLTGYRVVTATDVTVDGASSARRLDFTFTDGGVQRAGVWIAAAKGGDSPATATMAISSDGAAVDSTTVDQAVAALHWNDTGH